jgi:hypothetical protein
MSTQTRLFEELIKDRVRFMETLLLIENKQSMRVPFILNPIQRDAHMVETGRDMWVKPAQVGFSSDRLATRLIDTITTPGTNTVLIAYEEFITQRLLDKAQFFYNVLNSLGIPGFPKMDHRSSYEKTFPDIHSSMYISSARSYVAGRAETIHHLLADEHAFWEQGATERILAPAMDRVPPDGTIDILSTPNGEHNDFHDMCMMAKEGKSVFAYHFYPWFKHPEYSMSTNGILLIRDNAPNWAKELRTFELELDPVETNLVNNHKLTFDQIRWRRYKIQEKKSLRRSGELVKLFQQEFPEDDVSCWLAAGDMFYDVDVINRLAKGCYPAEIHIYNANVWYPPEPGKWYIVSIDPGQAKVTQTAIVVQTFEDEKPRYCARAAGLWGPETTVHHALELARYYNMATIAWEANSHGLAIAPLIKDYPNLYFRRDVVSGRESSELGWMTGPKTKPYMLNMMSRMLDTMIVHDSDFLSECRNIRIAGDRAVSVGADDIHDAVAIGLVCRDSRPVHRGFVGTSGYKW